MLVSKILLTKYKTMEFLTIVWALSAGILICIFYFWLVIGDAKRLRREDVDKEAIVLARVKEKRNSVWVCKFFKLGNHYGFFRRKPRSDRVEAVVVGYDEETGMYELKELR